MYKTFFLKSVISTCSVLLLFCLFACSTTSEDNQHQDISTDQKSKKEISTTSQSEPIKSAIQTSIQDKKKNTPPDAVAIAEQEKWPWPTETDSETAAHQKMETLDLNRPLVRSFIKKMAVEHGFSKDYIEKTLSKASNKPSILKIMSRPAEKSKEWFEYRPIFLTEKRISKGREFLQEHATALQSAEVKYGVPKEIIAAIIGVETYYGRITGKHKVLDSLVTLGFNYPPRAKFFRKELEQFFLLSREEGFDPTAVLGSYAGAMGNGQFISSSYRNFTADGDGDGKRDLWNSWPDAIHSVANYFHLHHWKKDEPVFALALQKVGCDLMGPAFPESKVSNDIHTVGSLRQFGCGLVFATDLPDAAPAMYVEMKLQDSSEHLIGFNNFYTITRYNRSPKYARAVYELSQELVR